jgi:predicted amidohydrolase
MQNIRVALIQFDAKPKQPDENLDKIKILVANAKEKGARWHSSY